MKINLLLLLFCISLSAQNNSLEDDYNKNDFVGLIKVKATQDSDFIEFQSLQVWKNCFADATLLKIDDEIPLEPDETYLVFASFPTGRKDTPLLVVNKESIVIKKQDIPKETFWFLTGQPCIDSSRKRNKACGVVRSIKTKICGCNGKDYWSECDADRDGVMKYKAGPCTE